MPPSSIGDDPQLKFHLEPRLTYRDYVHSLCLHNPSLFTLFEFLSRPRVETYHCRFAALDFRRGTQFPTARCFYDPDQLQHELHHNNDMSPEDELKFVGHPLEGRILIVEDLTVDVIEYLGTTLDIDPLFFAMHIHTMNRVGMRHPTPDEATLPSRFKSKDYINISYHRPVTDNQGYIHSDRYVRGTAIDRKLVFLQSPAIGFVQHSASMIKTRKQDQFWLAILLVDPPLSEKHFLFGNKGSPHHEVQLQLRPYLGQYENFAELPKFSENWRSLHDSTQGGMLDDVVRYWQRQVPSWFNSVDPSIQSLAYYPLQIVAAEWVKYTEVMHACIKRFEYQGSQLPSLSNFNSDLQELQSWRRRSIRSQEKCRAVIRSLKTQESHDFDQCEAMEALVYDFEVINTNIRMAGRRLENMIPIVTSLVQIIDARQSFAETANIRRLTVLALIFVPLSYVSSLFSMNPSNVPGSAHFWVYFAVAIPVTILVFLVARPPTAAFRNAIECIRSSKQRKRPHESIQMRTCVGNGGSEA